MPTRILRTTPAGRHHHVRAAVRHAGVAVGQPVPRAGRARRASNNTGAPPQPATDEEIAGRLFLNIGTVRATLQLLYERFGVAELPPEEQRAGLVERARAQGPLLPVRGR